MAINGREFFRTLYGQSRILAITGWIHLGLLAAMLAAMPFDSRLVRGINPWIKPSKFAISITIYVWTVAWLIVYPRLSPGLKRFLTWGISASMFVEIACIALQAGRGTTSHFNVAKPMDAAIFSVMGISIGFNSALVLVLLILFFTRKPSVSVPYLWGIRAGLFIFLIASGIGGVMVGHNSHAVGVEEGGPGLPFVNWSTTGGDLRVAHFLGLHALQILPVLGFLIGRRSDWRDQRQVALIQAISMLYGLLIGLLFWQAIHGSPVLRI